VAAVRNTNTAVEDNFSAVRSLKSTLQILNLGLQSVNIDDYFIRIVV